MICGSYIKRNIKGELIMADLKGYNPDEKVELIDRLEDENDSLGRQLRFIRKAFVILKKRIDKLNKTTPVDMSDLITDIEKKTGMVFRLFPKD